jgi:oligosaccharide repeat unit polymerase
MYNSFNFLPSIVFVALLYYNTKSTGRIISLSNFIILLYTISMISFGIYSLVDSTYFINVEAFFIVFFSILILIWPLAKFEKEITSEIKIIELEKERYEFLVFFIVSISVYSIFFFGKNIFQVFNSDLSVLRNQIMVDGGFYESSIFSKIAVFGAYLSPIALFLYFYTLAVHENYKLRMLLLLSSTSFIFYTLNVAGRDGIIIWVITYLALLCLFYPLLEREIIKNQKKLILTSMMIFLPILLIISFARFAQFDVEGSDDSNKNVLFSMINYIGMQPYELSDRIEQLEIIDYNGEPRSIYPLLFNIRDAFFGVVNDSDINNRNELRSESLDLGLKTQKFVYYIGDLLSELGMLGLIIVTSIIYFICRINLKIIDSSISISRLLISFTWYMIIIVGVFYFYYGQVVGNVFLLTPFLIHFYLKYRLV